MSGGYYGVAGELADIAEQQSTTACCPRETIPDSCSCLEDCDCWCSDCDCGMDADDEVA